MSNAEFVGTPKAVVVRFQTIMDGPVLRWYVSTGSDGHGEQEMCSASRNGVWEDANEVCPMDWLNDARQVADLLARDDHADTSAWETHKPSHFLGPLVPIEGAQSGRSGD